MKYYDKNKESSYLKYHNINSFYGWTILQKLPVNGFKWVEDFSEFDQGLQKVITKKVKKDIFSKLILDDKNEYVIQIRNLKQTLNHGSVLKKLYRVIKFNQKA